MGLFLGMLAVPTTWNVGGSGGLAGLSTRTHTRASRLRVPTVKRTQPSPNQEAFVPIFSVYVVELNKSICHRTACPSRDSGKPHVYVGETEQTPEERFEEHLAGGFTAARSVFKHGIRLKPRLYRNWGHT